ncbi:hypothetical protein BG015_010269, partial [Linnemannia schmuckeri]
VSKLSIWNLSLTLPTRLLRSLALPSLTSTTSSRLRAWRPSMTPLLCSTRCSRTAPPFLSAPSPASPPAPMRRRRSRS